MELSTYIAIHTHVFGEFDGPLAFDVYVHLGHEKYAKVFNKGMAVDNNRLVAYMQKGIHNLYIQREDRFRAGRIARSLLNDYMNDGTFEKEGAQSVLDHAAERVLDEVFSNHKMDAETYATTDMVVQSYVHIAQTSPAIFPKLLKLARTKKDVFKHSILTSIFSTLLARSLNPNDPVFWFKAGLSGLLHDVGLAQMPPRLSEHQDPPTPELKKLLWKHPQLSAQAIKVEGLPAEVEEAIQSHHENWDGSGYPRGLAKNNIPLLGRIVGLTEQFANLTNPPASEGAALTPHLAAMALRKGGKVDPQLIDLFAKMLNLN